MMPWREGDAERFGEVVGAELGEGAGELAPEGRLVDSAEARQFGLVPAGVRELEQPVLA